MIDGLVTGADGVVRCWWAGAEPIYQRYHDEEWGRPVGDDDRLYEKLCLEGFQSGLSWLTILKKRDAFRQGFAGFSIEAVAEFGDADVERLVADAGIVRHRGKIVSTINNARRARALRDETGESLAAFLWRFEPDPADRPAVFDKPTLTANPTTPASAALSKALRERGWTFVGPTTVYAFMQSMGLVNDHLEGCPCRAACAEARARFHKPVR
ncbi:DNA-3-methyladenine glycosylase I [Chthonobacter rhizosphaerae]|uniref:DNA-3-methyladenine glycosylase I n=1 Tax=Chthonobacter rhizosphaerae TaxID=2735553 RepID=UPI0015EEA5CC|nr:DNA-3-methyladenine glycosylase I [Chthonobacter rhizosphaerae]